MQAPSLGVALRSAAAARRVALPAHRLGLFVLLLLCLSLAAHIWFQSERPPTLTPVSTPHGPGARLPRLTAIPAGGALLSWVEPDGAGHALRFAVLKDGRVERQGTVARGAGWFVNWADFPSVVAIRDDFWVAHWLVLHPGGAAYAYDIALAVSTDAGEHWREIGPPHRDGVAAEHGFGVLFRDADAAGLIWLDGREFTIAQADPKAGPNPDRNPDPGLGTGADTHPDPNHTHPSGKFSLRFARIYADGRLGAEEVLDDNTCTCCWPAVATLADGAVAAWRGRTEAEVRDHRLAFRHAGVWSATAELGSEGWQIAGCPVNGPAVAVAGQRLLVTWYTAAAGRPRVRAALSSDAGRTFSPALNLDVDDPLGRVAAIWLDDTHALAAWLAASSDGQTTALTARRITRTGALHAPRVLLSLPAGRDTGVPQMLRDGEEIYFAWT
ncbi:MAG TPA: hypothetical protein DCY89_08890, partial [Gammaproteobacteria bacterium]|nr:hypothetical protein [Gammaproteobacteria bacterium]